MKDISNKASYNLWSGGEYNQDTVGLKRVNGGIILSCNDFFTIIGENSFKIIRTHIDLTRAAVIEINNLTGTTNLTVTFNIHQPNDDMRIVIADTSILSSVKIPKGTTSSISLSATTTQDNVAVFIQLGKINDYIYLTNIQLSY